MTKQVPLSLIVNGTPNLIIGYDGSGNCTEIDPSTLFSAGSDDINNDSSVSGSDVSDALESLQSQINSLGSSSSLPTTQGALGTYIWGQGGQFAAMPEGSTISGTFLRTISSDGTGQVTAGTQTWPGTWRNMGGDVGTFGGSNGTSAGFPTTTLWLRIA